MLGSAQATLNELHMVRDALYAIPNVEQAFAVSNADSLSVLVVVPDKNPIVQDQIIDVEGDVIQAFPSLDVDFDVVFRCNRDLLDIVSPKGVRLFAR